MLTTRTPAVVITLKGGHVQSVSTSRPDLLAGFKAVIIDHDISGMPLEDIVRHIGPDGDLKAVVVSVQEVEELTFPGQGREEGYFWAATVEVSSAISPRPSNSMKVPWSSPGKAEASGSGG